MLYCKILRDVDDELIAIHKADPIADFPDNDTWWGDANIKVTAELGTGFWWRGSDLTQIEYETLQVFGIKEIII